MALCIQRYRARVFTPECIMHTRLSSDVWRGAASYYGDVVQTFCQPWQRARPHSPTVSIPLPMCLSTENYANVDRRLYEPMVQPFADATRFERSQLIRGKIIFRCPVLFNRAPSLRSVPRFFVAQTTWRTCHAIVSLQIFQRILLRVENVVLIYRWTFPQGLTSGIFNVVVSVSRSGLKNKTRQLKTLGCITSFLVYLNEYKSSKYDVRACITERVTRVTYSPRNFTMLRTKLLPLDTRKKERELFFKVASME